MGRRRSCWRGSRLSRVWRRGHDGLWSAAPDKSGAGVRFCARRSNLNALGALFCNSVTPMQGSRRTVGRRGEGQPRHREPAIGRRRTPVFRRAMGRRKTPVFGRAMAAWRSKDHGAPGVPLDRFAPLAMTAMLQPLLGGHTVWESRSGINPKASFERPGASKGVQSPSENFNRFPRFQNYQWLTGERRPKKLPTAPWGGHGRAPPSRTVLRARMRFALANPGSCASRLRGLSSSIQILVCRCLIHFEAGLRSRRDAHSLRAEQIVNDAYPSVKKNVDFF
jgi:hypothetical protein